MGLFEDILGSIEGVGRKKRGRRKKKGRKRSSSPTAILGGKGQRRTERQGKKTRKALRRRDRRETQRIDRQKRATARKADRRTERIDRKKRATGRRVEAREREQTQKLDQKKRKATKRGRREDDRQESALRQLEAAVGAEFSSPRSITSGRDVKRTTRERRRFDSQIEREEREQADRVLGPLDAPLDARLENDYEQGYREIGKALDLAGLVPQIRVENPSKKQRRVMRETRMRAGQEALRRLPAGGTDEAEAARQRVAQKATLSPGQRKKMRRGARRSQRQWLAPSRKTLRAYGYKPNARGLTAWQGSTYATPASVSPDRRSGFDRALSRSGAAIARDFNAYPALKAFANVGRATVERPGDVAAATAASIPSLIAGAVTGPYHLVTDPEGTYEDIKRDYARRYDPDQAYRIATEEGIAGYGLDAATLGAIQGRLIGLGRASTRRARGGEFRQRRTPLQRTAGLPEGRTYSLNYFTAIAQRGLDKGRASRSRKRIRRAGEGGRGTRAVEGRFDAEGRPLTVVPLSKVMADLAMKRDRAREKGRGLIAIRRERRSNAARRKINRLYREERRAFRHVYEYGLSASFAEAKPFLERRRDQIQSEQTRRAEAGTPVRITGQVADEIAEIDWLLDNPDAFTARVRETASELRDETMRVGSLDPDLTTAQRALRRVEPQARLLELKRADGESHAAWLRRIRTAREGAGLEAAGYFPHARAPRKRFSDRTLGRGTQARAGARRTEYELLGRGTSTSDPYQVPRAMDESIKRRYSWNDVSNVVARHSLEGFRNLSYGQLRRKLDESQIAGDEIAIVDTKKLSEAKLNAVDNLTGELHPQALERALAETSINPQRFRTRPEDFQFARFSVVPRAVMDELSASSAPRSKAGRIAERVIKRWPLKVILGANPTWLATQLIGNQAFAAMVGVTPLQIVQSKRFFAKHPELKPSRDLHTGRSLIGTETESTRLGSRAGMLAEAAEGFHQLPFIRRLRGRGVHSFNPLDATLSVGRTIDDLYREGVLYSKLKREAYKSMAGEYKGFWQKMEGMPQILRKGPEERMVALMGQQKKLEELAAHVDHFMGDYMTYTAAERRIFESNIPFYGWLRFSLRWALYTMPTEHPIVTNLAANLSSLQEDKVRELLGADEDDPLPFGALANIHWDEDGQLVMAPLGRLHPGLNALMASQTSGQLVGMLPPIVVEGLNQVAKENLWMGQEWEVEGEQDPRVHTPYGTENRLRVLANNVLSLAWPYRAMQERREGGMPHGADSLAWSPRPTDYGDFEETIRRNTENRRNVPLSTFLARELPGVPQPSDNVRISKFLREKRREEMQRRRDPGRFIEIDTEQGDKGGDDRDGDRPRRASRNPYATSGSSSNEGSRRRASRNPYAN